jgi:hypothetical protein
MLAHSSRPYAIIAAMPGHKPRAIGRSNNRIDADSMARFLQRKVPNGAFYVIFDPEETCPLPNRSSNREN